MNRLKLAVAGAMITGSALVGGFVAGIFGTSTVAVNAANSTPVGATGATGTTGPGAFKSNEDQTHEKSESATRESDENSGKAPAGRAGRGKHNSNETAGHESSESAARESQETTPPTTAPSQ